ncbi:hypothetical protein HPB47_019712 [Ixodes persulcatus]|uniref:Uncharacterized protein n=1 Tax=Ixodes persulcatus TaxID=34615 RepID=A0AC60QHE6_IXOPE|nr:hypothetical protein HPB47_019712 [Ixodes persulcatus]
MDPGGPSVTLQPPMFDPGGTNSVNSECGSMDISISLTPGVEGTGTQAASTEAAAANVGRITRGMKSMLNQDNFDELGQIRAVKEDGREQAQGTPRPFQGITPPEVSQLFQVLAGVIERQPAFLQALQQFVARFMPPTQEAANDQPQPKQKDPRHYPRTRSNNDRSRSPRRPTTDDREAKSYQETQQMEDGGRLTPAHSIPQDGGRPPRADAPSCSNCTSQNLTPCQSVPSAPFTATSVCQTDDDREWPLPGTSSRKRKRNPPAMKNDEESMPRLLPVETVVLRSVRKKEVGAFTGKEIREAIEHYTVHRNDKANALSITTRDPALTEKLMQIREIRKRDEANTFQPYKALTRNQCRGNARCGTCGSEHDGMEECTKTPRCTNCDRGHVATSNDCPKRAIPPRSTSTKKTMKLAGRRGVPTPPPPAAIPASQDAGASYAAVTMGTFQSSVPQAYLPQRTNMAMQVLQLRYDGFARVEKQLAELTAAIHKLANWIKTLVQKDKHTILAGDFNARHTAWGCANKNALGKNIKKACVAAGLKLCNDPDTPTRLAQAMNQNDTSPDLTWISPRLRVQWQVQADPMGSDHLPIHIRFLIRTTPRRRVTFTKWDDFRTAISRLSGVTFADRIRQALSESRTEYNVREGAPSPNLHLVKLWDKRLEALLCYRTRKSLRNKIRLNHATAEAKRYTIKLCRTIWHSLCDSFNERTGYRRLWKVYKGLAGKTKTSNTGSYLALRLYITEEELAEEAGDCFFPQQSKPPTAKSQWKDGIELLKAISSKAWGAQEDFRRRLVRTILTSKVVYGLNYLLLTKNQEMTLVTMMRAAMRVVTGLPRFTPVDQLERIAQMNIIREISDEMRISQACRLSRNPHGRIILTSSGRPHLIEGPLIPTPTPPWDAEVVTPVKPLRSHQGLENPGRRATQAAIHRSEISKLAAHAEVFYTDAARDDSDCHDTLRPEIREARIYTDSQEAVRALRRSSTCNATVAQIRELVRQARARQTIIIAWIPGHADIPGNERANGAARALLQASIQPSQGPVPSPVQRDVPPDEDYDPSESKKEEKRARKERLSALLPSNPHPISRGLPRWEQVALHRLQSRSMVTPVWRARFHRPTNQQDTGPDPELYELWRPRDLPSPGMVLSGDISLPPPLRPTTLREWTHPRTSAPAEQTLVFSSIISYLRSSGTGRYI